MPDCTDDRNGPEPRANPPPGSFRGWREWIEHEAPLDRGQRRLTACNIRCSAVSADPAAAGPCSEAEPVSSGGRTRPSSPSDQALSQVCRRPGRAAERVGANPVCGSLAALTVNFSPRRRLACPERKVGDAPQARARKRTALSSPLPLADKVLEYYDINDCRGRTRKGPARIVGPVKPNGGLGRSYRVVAPGNLAEG